MGIPGSGWFCLGLENCQASHSCCCPRFSLCTPIPTPVQNPSGSTGLTWESRAPACRLASLQLLQSWLGLLRFARSPYPSWLRFNLQGQQTFSPLIPPSSPEGHTFHKPGAWGIGGEQEVRLDTGLRFGGDMTFCRRGFPGTELCRELWQL